MCKQYLHGTTDTRKEDCDYSTLNPWKVKGIVLPRTGVPTRDHRTRTSIKSQKIILKFLVNWRLELTIVTLSKLFYIVEHRRKVKFNHKKLLFFCT